MGTMENVLGIARVLEMMENVKMILFMHFYKVFKAFYFLKNVY